MDTRHSPASHTEKPAADAVENRMKIAVRDIGIPPRPTILAQIEQETAKDNPDFIYLAKLLSHDVGLSAGIVVRSDRCGPWTWNPGQPPRCEREVSRRYWHHVPLADGAELASRPARP